MKLEVGQFVRTKDGIIDKVIIDYNGHCASPNCECKHISCAKNYYDEDKIVKASYNIIDILEVEDFVNRHLVIDIMRNNRKDEPSRMIYCEYGNGLRGFYNEGIKSVITHEQMEQMTYKVEK